MSRYDEVDKIKKAHGYVMALPENELKDWPEVIGTNFNEKLSLGDFLKSFYGIGFQATHLYKAIKIFQNMRKDNATIFLGYTSNMATSGIRDIIAYLTKEKILDVLVTTAGGVEEDIIKTHKPFVLGSYDSDGSLLRDQGINRSGNIFVPNDRYIFLEGFMNKVYNKMYEEQKTNGKIFNSCDLMNFIGEILEDYDGKETSICYWAYKNKIPLFCPGFTDGSLGDILFFFKQRHPDFKIDITDDIVQITNIAINAEKTGIIALGGSLPKHHIANANLFRDGADYVIYLTTAHEFEGSNAGANIEEGKSWGKIKSDAQTVKVVGDASITFPLIVAGLFNMKD